MNRELMSYPERHRSFEHWFQTSLGRALLADQRQCIDTKLEQIPPAARQLQVGVSHRLPLAGSTDFTQKIVTTPEWSPDLPEGVAVCDADELPFPNDSIDLVILHHTADFSAYPHQVIREASRVMRGGGQLLVFGFNPLSLWGLRRLVSRSHRGPWGARFIMRSRMEDWLSLLDFQVESSDTFFLRPPLQRSHTATRPEATERNWCARVLPVGAYYCILATKRVYASTRTRQAWRRNNVVAMPGAISVSARHSRTNESSNDR
ncbi:class I SAM-dependent methyltransferase [Marinobacter sp. X15-166B]|uniref:class I SAM-dependent methyltransferase n=1 Tax=Marinobacter sp. X15-166B TaxID=1897620 RepID=UPI00085C8E58|nr:class I SAM-dependent methyltransferase [Marinobacter sp. X15-166B]OEY67687.1 methyltransferase type 11 [Marinobacter sp. X15-166B]